ncbi:hypothetical protein M2451_002758 [Dysgonomonas sp. PFB1-18]|uniref:hypothetical protein n=1 Tax=unclassified Dysgonomonas TaxID=2630389 RepID=UPI002475A12C|nr:MULTISPECIES: hypothetical protein [unclassified Dysgonomonas]MDH6309356.1 hypothetical protein [Dysgonomonas sp. PF1-14]MDH6339779.1 hypothetical protein [Dysgonomonas sp. PF1-16]MDH6381427.1 hypothetical protein [Dysgonomonas sp. PFB1-18]MDH6398642.1 hypothetical protein [Dysgonomonas sp. PF1-23]
MEYRLLFWAYIEKELMISIQTESKESIDNLGLILKDLLLTTIYYGTARYVRADEYEFEIIKQF